MTSVMKQRAIEWHCSTGWTTNSNLAAEGQAIHPVFQRLTPLIRDLDLSLEPFRNLIEANRVDQVVTRYENFEDLVGYCMLSAAPVGRLVLAVFQVSTPERTDWSDQVCIALQVVEHLQDVGEDARRGRIYLPLDDLASSVVAEEELLLPTTSAALRRVVAKETLRTRGSWTPAISLAASLPIRARLAVTGFVGGGLAATDAIERANYDVLGGACRHEHARRHRPHGARFRARESPPERGMNLEAAYDWCEGVTRREAKNFAYGIRLLHKPERQALSAVYALARRIDDIGDGDRHARREARRASHRAQGDRVDRSEDERSGAVRHRGRRRSLSPADGVLR